MLQWNHIPSDNRLEHAVFILQHKGAVSIDPASPTGDDLTIQLRAHTLPAQVKTRFPTRPKSVETGRFKDSITPVEVSNQSV